MKPTNYSHLAILFLLGISSLRSYAQVVINQSDILNLVGKNYSFEQALDDSVIVNVGSPGANQTWDLTNIAFEDTLSLDQSFLLPSETPYDTAFPQANFASSSQADDGTFALDVYSYWIVDPDLILTIGDVTVFYNMGTPGPPEIEAQIDTAAPVPLSYNDTWTSILSDTTDFGGGTTQIDYDTTFNTVDGWGTLKLPAGDFPCLRIREFNSYRSVFLSNNVPISTDIEQNINYLWISKEHFRLAGVDSRTGDLDPNFTIAETMVRLKSINPGTGLEDRLTNAAFSLPRVQPNPIQGESQINFTLKRSVNVHLQIYTLQGQLVGTLAEGILQAGDHMISWNGEVDNGTLSNGMYLLTLQSEGITHSQKVIIHK